METAVGTLVKLSIVVLIAASIGVMLTIVPAAEEASADAGLDHARELFDRHEYDGARDAIDTYLKSRPNNPDALIVKSDIYAALGQWDKSVEQ
jgi:uncharacterized protein HemY